MPLDGVHLEENETEIEARDPMKNFFQWMKQNLKRRNSSISVMNHHKYITIGSLSGWSNHLSWLQSRFQVSWEQKKTHWSQQKSFSSHFSFNIITLRPVTGLTGYYHLMIVWTDSLVHSRASIETPQRVKTALFVVLVFLTLEINHFSPPERYR